MAEDRSSAWPIVGAAQISDRWRAGERNGPEFREACLIETGQRAMIASFYPLWGRRTAAITMIACSSPKARGGYLGLSPILDDMAPYRVLNPRETPIALQILPFPAARLIRPERTIVSQPVTSTSLRAAEAIRSAHLQLPCPSRCPLSDWRCSYPSVTLIFMKTVQATVVKGRLVVDEPTNLPEGTVIELAPLDAPGDEELSEEEWAVLRPLLERSCKSAEQRRGQLLEETLQALHSNR